MASIKKVNERKYKITVCNGYHADGKKICKAKTIEVPKSVQKRSIMQYVHHEAEEFERSFKTGYSEVAEETFEQYAEGWILRQHHHKQGTLIGYHRMLKICYPYIGAIPLNRLQPLAIEHMLDELRKLKKKDGQPLKEVTVQKYLSVVSAVLSDAKRNDLIPHNPARMVSLPALKSEPQAIPTMEEMNLLVQELQKEPLVYRTYFLMSIFTGARRGELAALTWGDVSMEKIVISKSRSYVSGIGYVTDSTKNGKTRVIASSRDIWQTLLLFRLYQNTHKVSVQPNAPIFTDVHGRQITPDHFSRRLRKIYDRCGLSKKYHLHTLRHFFATQLLQNNTSKQVVADILGHGDTSFLERTYCHPQLEAKRTAMEQSSRQISKMLHGA